MQIETCPHCSMQVIYTATGECPGCRLKRTDKPELPKGQGSVAGQNPNNPYSAPGTHGSLASSRSKAWMLFVVVWHLLVFRYLTILLWLIMGDSLLMRRWVGIVWRFEILRDLLSVCIIGLSVTALLNRVSKQNIKRIAGLLTAALLTLCVLRGIEFYQGAEEYLELTGRSEKIGQLTIWSVIWLSLPIERGGVEACCCLGIMLWKRRSVMKLAMIAGRAAIRPWKSRARQTQPAANDQ